MKTPKTTAFGSYGYGWQQLWKYFLHLFLVFLVCAIANVPGQGLFNSHQTVNSAGFATLSILIAAYSIMVLPVINYGGNWMYLRFMRDERPNVADMFSGFKTKYLNIILANLLVFAIVGIGMVLLLIPGIIFACRLSFVPYLVMDKGLDPVAAIEKSWFMTRGHGWRIFGMYLLAFVFVIVGFCLLLVGAVFAIMWVSCAFASLYYAIDAAEQAQLNQNGNHGAA
jgi:uncharacterized membrane protein